MWLWLSAVNAYIGWIISGSCGEVVLASLRDIYQGKDGSASFTTSEGRHTNSSVKFVRLRISARTTDRHGGEPSDSRLVRIV